jgi:hypothetical protein
VVLTLDGKYLPHSEQVSCFLFIKYWLDWIVPWRVVKYSSCKQ